MALSNEYKIAIIKNNITRLEQQEYDTEINARVAKRVGNEAKDIEKALSTIIKAIDEFKKELAEIEKGE